VNETKNGCGKVIGITCGSIFGLGFLVQLFSISSQYGPFGSIGLLAVLGLVAILVIRSRKNNKTSAPVPIYQAPPTIVSPSTVKPTAVPAPRAVNSPPILRSTTGIGNPVCIHAFSPQTLETKEIVVCECGNSFYSADLLKYDKLSSQVTKLETQLYDLNIDIRSKLNNAKTKPLVTAANAIPAPVKAPAIEKPKISFSLQQWLIIGASLLVLVAGSVFVNSYQGIWPQWAFEVITVAIAAGMAFGAFAMRKISGIIASFLAAFSIAMQIATMSIVGNQLSDSFAWGFNWSNAPVWYWSITLIVITLSSTLLARASYIFGFKGLALLAATGGSLTLGLSVLRRFVPGDWALVNFAAMGLLTIGFTYLAKYIRTLGHYEPEDNKFKEYAKDVARREDNGLLAYTRIAALIQVVAGLGLALTSWDQIFGTNLHFAPNPYALLVFVAVVAFIGLTAKKWTPQLSKDGKEISAVLGISSGIVYLGLSIALLSFVTSYTNGWLSAGLALVVILAQAWFSGALKQMKPKSVLVTVGIYLSAALWAFTILRDQFSTIPIDLLAWFVIGLALVLILIDKRFSVHTNSWMSVILNSLGALVLVGHFKSTTGIESTSMVYALIGLAVLLVPLAPLVIRYLLQAKKDETNLTGEAWLSTFVSALLGCIIAVPNVLEDNRNVNLLLGLSFAFIVYSAVSYLLTKVFKVAERILIAHHYLGQILSVVVVATTATSLDMISSPRLYYTAVVAGLVVLNYAIGAIDKQAFKLHIGYVLMIGAFFINMWGVTAKWLVTVSAVQFLAIALLTYIHYLMLTKRTDASASVRLRTVLLGICGSLLIGLGAQWNTWIDTKVATGKDAFLVLGLLALLAAISLLLAKAKKISEAAKQILSWLSVSYSAFGVVTSVAYVAVVREIDSRFYVVVALVLLSLFTRLKNVQSKMSELVVLFFASNLVLAGIAASLIQAQSSLPFTPELYSAFLALALISSTLLSNKATGKLRSILLVEIPVLGSAGLSLVYALAGPDNGLNANLREVLGTALISGFALFRLRKNPVQGWIVTSYAATIAFAVSLAYTITKNWVSYNGPEIYSLLAAVAILGVHRVALKHLKLKSTLFSWGFPIGVALIPSTFFTYTAWGITFAHLGMDQIARELIALAVSIVLLTLGLRKGNLANASMGITGLTLLLIPAVASQSDGMGNAWQVQNTAMVAGGLLFAILAIARLGGKLTGTSRLFLGIPITITLAPALFNSLVALSKPDLEAMDWWRFGIILVVTLTMLVLGTVREVAGLFFPGLIGVLLTALPYGFKQTQKEQWFLWVLLLLLAGVMVWLAMRLERMRKAGRTSSAWLRQLK